MQFLSTAAIDSVKQIVSSATVPGSNTISLFRVSFFENFEIIFDKNSSKRGFICNIL